MVEGAVEEGKSVLVMPLLLSYGGIEDGIRHRLEGLEEPLVRILCGEHCVDVVGFLGGAAFELGHRLVGRGEPRRRDQAGLAYPEKRRVGAVRELSPRKSIRKGSSASTKRL